MGLDRYLGKALIDNEITAHGLCICSPALGPALHLQLQSSCAVAEWSTARSLLGLAPD